MTKRDALILLVHYMGDVHQPLHVGQVYLDGDGNLRDPDQGTGPTARSTFGGNQLTFFDGRKTKLHGNWDGVVVGDYSIADARKVAPTEGPMDSWISQWVTDTLTVARGMPFAAMTFGEAQGGEWNVVFADRPTYRTERNKVQRVQIEKAGARLTQLLVAIWPD